MASHSWLYEWGVILTTYIHWDGPPSGPSGHPKFLWFLAMSLSLLLPGAPQDDHQHVATVVPRGANCHTNVAAPFPHGVPATSFSLRIFVAGMQQNTPKPGGFCWSCAMLTRYFGRWHFNNEQTFGFKVEDQKNAEILGFPRSDVLTRWRPISGHHLRCSLPNKHWDAHKASWTEPLSLETGSKNNISKGKITVNTSIAVSGSLNRW